MPRMDGGGELSFFRRVVAWAWVLLGGVPRHVWDDGVLLAIGIEASTSGMIAMGG